MQGGHSLLSGAASPRIEALTLTASRTLAIASGCPAVSAKLKGTKHGIRVVAKWPAGACAGLKGRIQLRARIDAKCQTMHGRLHAKKLQRPFIAQLSRCGDGILDRDGDEQCDLLEGDPAAPAQAATFDMPPVGVDQSEIENGIIMTRLDVRFAPGATVSQVNNALALVEGRIVTMTGELPFVTIAVPRPPSLAALRQLAHTLNVAPGILWAFVGGPSEPQVLPFAASAFPNRNLLPTRFPAAWNAMHRAAQDCDTRKVPVLVADDFIRGASITLPFDDEVPGFRLLPLDSNGGDTHGYDVTTTMAALFNDRNRTGANPFTECLAITGIQVGGLEPSQELFRMVQHFPVGQRFILNFSRALRGKCDSAFDFDGPAPIERCEEGSASQIPTAYERAAWAEEWKKRTFDHWDSFLVTPAAGNFRGNQANPEGLAARIYPGLGIARFASALSIVTDADPSFGFISNTGLWQPTVSDPPLIATADEIARLRAAIEHDALQQIGRADNVVITGSTAPGNTFVDLLESSFSNSDPDVVAVGESITTLGPVTQGTSFAAPQVAGLASYLWLLSDDLRKNQPIAVTRRAIVENTREMPLAGPVIDAYAAILSLDAATLPTPSSAPIRLAILDLNNDGQFDERDISAFLGLFLDSDGNPVQPASRDYLRFDLNGDGFTGGSNTERFDLDRMRSSQYGATNYAPDVTQEIDGTAVHFDSNSVTDLQVLCYYAYSALYQGDPDARSGLLAGHCGQGLDGPWTGTVFGGSEPACVIISQNQNAISGTIHQFGGTATLLATLSASQLLGVTIEGFFVEADCTATGSGTVNGNTITINVTPEAACNGLASRGV